MACSLSRTLPVCTVPPSAVYITYYLPPGALEAPWVLCSSGPAAAQSTPATTKRNDDTAPIVVVAVACSAAARHRHGHVGGVLSSRQQLSSTRWQALSACPRLPKSPDKLRGYQRFAGRPSRPGEPGFSSSCTRRAKVKQAPAHKRKPRPEAQHAGSQRSVNGCATPTLQPCLPQRMPRIGTYLEVCPASSAATYLFLHVQRPPGASRRCLQRMQCSSTPRRGRPHAPGKTGDALQSRQRGAAERSKRARSRRGIAATC